MAGIELGNAYVTLLPSTRGFQPAVKKALGGIPAEGKKVGDQLGDNMSTGMEGAVKSRSSKLGGVLKVGLVGAAAAAGVAVGAAFSGSIQAASNLEQSVGGVDAIFKDQAGVIHDAAKEAATGLGLSTNAYNELATTLGAGLKNKGIEDFTGQTQDLLGLGADLAAQFGGSTADAVSAISSLMRGEADPIERYGVAINETAIKARMAEKGLTGLEGAALEQAKAQTRLELLFEQTADAQGAFGRESDTLEGKQQRAAAQWDNLRTKIGGLFLPAISGVMGFINTTVLPGFDRFMDVAGGVADILFRGDFSGGLMGIEEDHPLVGFLFSVREGFQQVGDILGGAASILFKGDFTGGLMGIEEDHPLVGFLFTVREGFQTFADTVQNGWASYIQPALETLGTKISDLWATVQPILADLAAIIMEKWQQWAPTIQGYWDQITQIIGDAINFISTIIGVVTDAIKWVWANWGDEITAIIGGLWDGIVGIFGGALDIIQGIVRFFTAIFSGDWSAAKDAITQITQGMWDVVRSIFETVGGVVRTIFGGIGDWLSEKADRIRDSVVEAFTRMKDGIGEVWDKLRELAAKPVNFIIETVYNDGILRLINGFLDIFPGEQQRLTPLEPIKYAEGGFARGTAGIATRPVLFGEVPGVDEAYVPLDGSERSRGIWLEAGRRLGMVAMATGGIMPANGVLTSSYGYRVGPFLGAENHDGVDIGAALGSPVVAALPGTVVFAGWNGGYGNQVTIDHGDGLRTFYAHMSSIAVGVGQMVQAAQLIGAVGSTGLSTDPHLHFGASQNGASIDPMSVVSGAVTGGGGLAGIFGLLASLPERISEIWDQLSELGGSVWGRMLSGAVGSLLDKIPEWAQSLFGANLATGDYEVGAGAQQWSSVALQAMQMAGLPESYLSLLLHRIQVESGGDPNAINLWDSNAAMGQPSQGLMQTIPSTFYAYAGELAGRGITDPLANIYAAIRYTIARYGMSGIEAAWSGTAGYANGTMSASPGLRWVGERGPELVRFRGGEQVYTAAQSRALTTGSGPAVDVDDLARALVLALARSPIRVEVDGRQIASAVRSHDRSLAGSW